MFLTKQVLYEGVRNVIRITVDFFVKGVKKAVQRGDLIVIIDVLRCSSSIITALAKGAKSILPVKTVMEARKIHNKYPNFILAGERKSIPPSGFQFNNSPCAFSLADLNGKHVILTTTSGTKAIAEAKNADYILIGAIINAKSVGNTALRLAEKDEINITLALAGHKGNFSLEDFIGAGAIANSISKKTALSDSTQAAILAFRKANQSLYEAIAQGTHATYLINIGLKEDVRFCTRLNSFMITPYFREGIITV
jgi:2-phosphosulfolactate phosphatase